jgi:hypothetical protein
VKNIWTNALIAYRKMGEIGKGGNIVRVPITIILIQLCFIKYQIFTPCLESKLCVDCNKNNTVGAITRAETSYPSRAIIRKILRNKGEIGSHKSKDRQ